MKYMVLKVNYLLPYVIERDVTALLAEYGHACGINVRPPIPVEEILENHLKLTLDFDDLHEKLGVPMMGEEPVILSALWVDTREVFIDQSLDPEEYPRMEGRFRFSIGHEIGHWRLHRSYLTSDPAHLSPLDIPSKLSVICRTSQAKERVEWQADYYASCLLMPRAMVLAAWQEYFNGRQISIVYELLKGTSVAAPPHRRGPRLIQNVMRNMLEPEHHYLFNLVAKEFAPVFQVSAQAMRIRLQKLGLLLVERPKGKSLAQLKAEIFGENVEYQLNQKQHPLR
jgi:Zn-dependent peptidase ImmA (M78 family)